MKIARTLKHPTSNIKSGRHNTGFFLGLSFVCCFLFSLSTIDIAAQANVSPAPVPEISTEDYPIIKWKSPVDYGEVLSIEKSNTASRLATPNLPADEVGLYTGYDRLLSYMQEELSHQSTVETIALKSYTKVVTEIPGDAILQHMKIKDFEDLYDALLPKLIKP